MKITPTMRDLMFRYALAAKHTSPTTRDRSRPSTKQLARAVAKLRDMGWLEPDPRHKALRLTETGFHAFRVVCEHRSTVDAGGFCIACDQKVS